MNWQDVSARESQAKEDGALVFQKMDKSHMN